MSLRKSIVRSYKGDLNHIQVEFLAQMSLNVILDCKNSLHPFHGGKKCLVIIGQLLYEFAVITYPRPCQVCSFIGHVTSSPGGQRVIMLLRRISKIQESYWNQFSEFIFAN